VTVLRDGKGMAYIYAQNIDDAFMAQGFVYGSGQVVSDGAHQTFRNRKNLGACRRGSEGP